MDGGHATAVALQTRRRQLAPGPGAWHPAGAGV